jgi:hypothetical protein
VPRCRTAVLALVATLLVACLPAPASAAPAGASTSASAAAKKRCKKGTKRVRVKRAGKTRWVCRKAKKQSGAKSAPAPAGPAGPSVAEVESIIRGLLQAQAPYPLPAEAVQVSFEQPTQVLPMVMYDPYEGDPLHAGGPVEAWPVRAWVKSVTVRDATPEDDTDFGGCLGHRNSWWPYDTIYMFNRGLSGEWVMTTSSVTPGRWTCG